MSYLNLVICMRIPQLGAQKRVQPLLEEVEVNFAVALRWGRAISISITARRVPVVLPHVADADSMTARLASRLHTSETSDVSLAFNLKMSSAFHLPRDPYHLGSGNEFVSLQTPIISAPAMKIASIPLEGNYSPIVPGSVSAVPVHSKGLTS